METTTAETLPLLTLTFTLHHRRKLRRQIRAAGVTREEQPFLLNRLPSRPPCRFVGSTALLNV